MSFNSCISSVAGTLQTPTGTKLVFPEPLQRYLNYAIINKIPVKGVSMKLRGKVILPGKTERLSVEGHQFINAEKPEFDWIVKAKVNMLLTAHIHDRYINSIGKILSKINGFWTVIDDQNIDALNRTQLTRWSGLAVMAPHAFKLKNTFKWKVLSPNSIETLVSDGELTIRHKFIFDKIGRMIRSESTDRWERYDGVYKKTGSIMERFSYKRIDGIRVPTKFIIHRIEPDGSKTKFWVGEFYAIKVIR